MAPPARRGTILRQASRPHIETYYDEPHSGGDDDVVHDWPNELSNERVVVEPVQQARRPIRMASQYLPIRPNDGPRRTVSMIQKSQRQGVYDHEDPGEHPATTHHIRHPSDSHAAIFVADGGPQYEQRQSYQRDPTYVPAVRYVRQ